MINLSSIVRAFGGVANVLALVIIWQFMPGPELTQDFLKGFLYKQMTWGGIWGFAFLIPVMTNNWILRGIVWGVASTAVALLVFKVMPISVPTVIIGLVVNSGAWGLVSSWLYQKTGPRQAGGGI